MTLDDTFINMLGFTQSDVDKYLGDVIEEYEIKDISKETLKSVLKNYYDGYRFAVDAEQLYNSTIITYFLRALAMKKVIPKDFIDPNLTVDINWIYRLTLREENTKEMLNKIIFDGGLEYDEDKLLKSFKLNTFFNKEHYPCSLFYLGMLTIEDENKMVIPNQTMQNIMTEYFNEVQEINVSEKYHPSFDKFKQDLDLEKLFKGYWEIYISQFPAQMFQNANENFFRSTFYELCCRYLKRYFIFEIEVNQHGGRTDLEFLGRHTTEYKNIKYLVEFKHFNNEKTALWNKLTKPRKKDKDQLAGYAKAISNQFPELNITKWMIYTYKGKDWKVFKIND